MIATHEVINQSVGFYVLAAAVLEVRAQQPACELMRRLLGSRRTNKLHWHEMDRLQQVTGAKRCLPVPLQLVNRSSTLDGHVVATTASVTLPER